MLVMETAPSRLHNIGSPECIGAPNGIYMPMDLKLSGLRRQGMPGVRHEHKSMAAGSLARSHDPPYFSTIWACPHFVHRR
jgi:hypothetical protein